MGGGGIHVQLPYTVINMWSINVWWRGYSHAANIHGNWWLVRATYVVDGLFFGHFFWKVEGSCAHTRESRVAHVHGNALTCSIPSMVEGSPSCTAHVWLTCTVMPSRVAFPQWWRGAPHVQLACGSRAR